MKKLLPIIVAIAAIVLIALFYSKKPTSQTSAPPSTQGSPSPTVQQPAKFDSNDNLDQALHDLQALDGSGIQ